MIEAFGPTNTRQYTVAVYFRNERLAKGRGHSIQQAEMSAARNALNQRSGMCMDIMFMMKILNGKQIFICIRDTEINARKRYSS